MRILFCSGKVINAGISLASCLVAQREVIGVECNVCNTIVPPTGKEIAYVGIIGFTGNGVVAVVLGNNKPVTKLCIVGVNRNTDIAFLGEVNYAIAVGTVIECNGLIALPCIEICLLAIA